MSQAPAVSRAASAPSHLTARQIGVLFLPLALTSTMMSVSVPVINAGLARHPAAEANLAVFSLAFSLSIFLESPVFALQQAVVAWYGGRGPFRHLVIFSLGVGLAMMGLEAAVAFSPAGPFLFHRLLGAPDSLIPGCVDALRVSVLFPPMVAVRLAFQGVLVSRHNGAPIAWGTFLRLAFLGALIFLVCPRLPFPAPATSMAALAVAVFVETFLVARFAVRTPERQPVPSPAQAAGRRLSGRVRFLLPLAGTMALGTLTNPLINAVISRTPEPEVGLAVYAVVSSLLWFMASPTLRYSAVTIALGTTPDNLKRLAAFLWRFVGGISILVLAVTLTPVARTVLEGWIGLSPDLAARARLPLVLLSAQPLIAGFIAYNQGLLTRSARTGWVGIGSISRAVAILSLGVVGLALGLRGGLLGGILLGAAFVAELSALLLLRSREKRPAEAV